MRPREVTLCSPFISLFVLLSFRFYLNFIDLSQLYSYYVYARHFGITDLSPFTLLPPPPPTLHSQQRSRIFTITRRISFDRYARLHLNCRVSKGSKGTNENHIIILYMTGKPNDLSFGRLRTNEETPVRILTPILAAASHPKRDRLNTIFHDASSFFPSLGYISKRSF